MPATWHPHAVGLHPDEEKVGRSRRFNPKRIDGAPYPTSRPVSVAQLRREKGLPPIAKQ